MCIRVLLVDDYPTFSMVEDVEIEPSLPRKFANLFKLTWLQNATEARWAMETFDMISERSPSSLATSGWPPEILVFDYALTQRGNFPRPASSSTNICARLQNVSSELGIDTPYLSPADVEDPPDTDSEKGEDRTGCYVGGSLARSFALHPCGAVPTTARIETLGTDAEFYQWMNKRYFYELFDHKSRSPTWVTLLSVGAHALRQRIVDLVRSHVIRVSLEDLFAIKTDPESQRTEHLCFSSRYGMRRISIEGLFFDCLRDPEANDTQYLEEAQSWTKTILQILFKDRQQEHFQAAKELANRFWLASISESSDDRYELSRLAGLEHRTDKQEARLSELCTLVGVDVNQAKRDPAKAEVRKNSHHLGLWRNVADDDTVARWSALMLAVRAEQFHRLATEDGLKILGLMNEGGGDIGEVSRQWLNDRVGDTKEVERLLQKIDIAQSDYVDDDIIRVPQIGVATLEDIYSALDPLPDSLLTFYDKGKLRNGVRSKDVTTIFNSLKRLEWKKNNWGPLGLNIKDLLQGRAFDCPVCRQALLDSSPFPEDVKHEDPKTRKGYSHGIRPGEGQLLRMFADEIGFPEAKWPAWLRFAP